ncbi:MAG TPA: glycosyltransferase [Burkholderiales bacterium]|nr:glycosyltransferase [Burkholderiales bacterium]
MLEATVIVCTYNRADSLVETLKAISAQIVRPNLRWEVIVVDNNSKDQTRQVVERFSHTFPLVRYIFEPNQGLSYARNTAIKQAGGDVLLFTDDDVAPEQTWLQQIVDGMDESRCDACGGFIAPVWQSPPPPWLTQRFHGFLAIKAERSDTYEIRPGDPLPYGANMAFRRQVFDHFGLFDVSRGRRGKILASGEDGEFFERILARGAKVMFFGDARVHHNVESFRLTKNYFRRWRYQTSRNLAESRGVGGTTRLLGVPLYMYPQTLRAIGRALFARLYAPADEAFFREIIAWHFLGCLDGLRRRRRP